MEGILWLWYGGTAVSEEVPSPSNLTLIARNETSLTLEWTVPSDTNQTLDRYVVWVSTLGHTYNHTFPPVGNTSSVQREVLGNLSPGDSYNITVFGQSHNGKQSNGSFLADATTSPSPVDNLDVTARNATSLTLRWTVPNDTNQGSYTYVVKVGTNRTETFTLHATGGTPQTVVIGGLSPGVTYDLTVYSRTSNDVMSTGKNVTNQTSPSPVTNLTVIDRNMTSLMLRWTVPHDTNRSSYSYEVWVVSARNETLTLKATGGTTETMVIGGLLAGVTYNLTVYSRTSDGSMSTGESVTNQTNPSPVTNLDVTARNATSLTLRWTVPNDTNQGSYTYVVKVGTTRTENFALNATGGTPQLVVIEGLSPGVTYDLTVYSRTSNDVMSTGKNVTNQTNPSPVTNLVVTARNETSLTLRWTVPNDTDQGSYTYVVMVEASTTQTFNSDVAEGATMTVDIVGLSPGVAYNLTVYSRTSNGSMSTGLSLINQTTSPSPVTYFKVIGRNKTSLTLQWTVPNNTNQASYKYVVMVVGTTHNETFNSDVADGTKKTEVIRNLSPGVSYNLSIYSLTSNGFPSTWTNLSNEVTSPSPVTEFTVIARNMTSLTLRWTVPNDTNQGSYTYVVKVGTNRTENFTLNAPGGTPQSVAIGDLSPGVPYDLTVYSRTSNGIMSTAFSLTNQTTMPTPVTNLTVANRNETSFTLEWMVPKDTYQTSYTYLVMVSSHPNTTVLSMASDGAIRTKVVTGLEPGFPYNITVYSVTWDLVMSTPTSLADATTMPSQVSTFSVTNRNETSLTLQWTVPKNIRQRTYQYLVKVDALVSVANQVFRSDVDAGNNQTGIITGLTPGIPYNLSMFSVTTNNISSVGTTTVNETNPSPVDHVNISKRTNSSITIAWTVPHNILVDQYSYWVKVVNNDNVIKATVVKGNNSLQDDLKPGTLYKFLVQSVTRNNVSSFEKQYQGYSDPNQPENLMGSPSNDTTILVKWTPPVDPNVRNYTYTVILHNTKNTEANHTTTTSANNASISALFPGNRYIVSVISQIEDASSTVTQIFAQTNPQAVKRLTPPNITNTTATFTWDLEKQNNSELSGFQINVTMENRNPVKYEINPSLRSYTIGDLTPGTNYTFEFFSVSGSSLSSLSSRRRRQTDNPLVTYSPAITVREQTEPGTASSINCIVQSGGYTLGVMWECPKGNFTQIKILVNGKENTKTDQCKEVTVTGLQPASNYEISVQTIAGVKVAISPLEKCKTSATGVIVGAIFGVLLFLALIALIVFFVLKHRRTKGGFGSSRSVSMNRLPSNIAVDKFPSYFQQQHADSDFGFAEEYQLLVPVGTDQMQTAAQQMENRPKNRYTNVLPYDISRVKLRSLPTEANSDYINANYMPGYNSNKEFIATQGPLPTTIGDFWRMVWEHRVGTLVMLTNCTEGGKLKCEHYWPLDYTPCTYVDITVTVTSETILPQWTTREFTLRHAKEPGIRYVSHFHYTVWPDHGVPDETNTVIKFRNMVRDHMNHRKSNGPAVVHCSAGVGRTGTLIALDFLVQQAENEKVLGIFNFIKKMRLNRPFMVQTESQYIFLNQCMLDFIERPSIENENIYENQIAGDIIYENFDAINQYGKTPNGKLA